VLKLLVERTNVREKNSAGLTALDIVRQLPAHVNEISARSILENREKENTLFERGMPGDTRNAVLVVAVLIATAAYQGVLSPPGGLNQGNNGNTNTSTGSFDASGKAVMSKQDFYSFMLYNSGALAVSLGLIVFFIPLTSANDFVLGILLVSVPLISLLCGYLTALRVISPLDFNKLIELLAFILLTFIVFVLVKFFMLYFSRRRLCKLMN
ncbi:hypothetical protein MIMGU_mgv1a021607mg, partial [Erythranthe guttata]